MNPTQYEFLITRRYMKARGGQWLAPTNKVTTLSIVGIAIGVAALIIVLSVMNGFEAETRTVIVGFDGHIRLKQSEGNFKNYRVVIDQIRELPHIVSMSPLIEGRGLIRSKNNNAGVVIRGVNEKHIGPGSELSVRMVIGKTDLTPQQSDSGFPIPGIVMGRWLADQLLVSLGDEVHLISPSGMTSLFQTPSVKRFIVTGLFETQMNQFDDMYTFISIEAAQQLMHLGDEVTGIEIRLDDMYKANDTVEIIKRQLGAQTKALTWFQLRGHLFNAMLLEKYAMFLGLSLIVIVASFSIITTLSMSVIEKTMEIGILKSMGATAKSISKIFIFQGGAIGLFGLIFGIAIGYTLCALQIKYEFISAGQDVFNLYALPMQMKVTDFIFIGLATLLISIGAAVHPARKAAKLDPMEALRT